jgi:HAD superfamily hydrolase (TIGR01549 family)
MAEPSTGILLDLDGTLVDSVFQHVLAWDDAFRESDFDVPLWRVHAAIGMGSDRLVSWVLGRTEAELGSQLKAMTGAHEQRFVDRAGSLRPAEGARQLLDDLTERGVPYLVLTSSTGQMTDVLLDALGRDDLPILGGDDTPSTKPAPDPVLHACSELGIEPRLVTMVGDSPWDAEAAVRVGVRTVGVRTGGFATTSLKEAGCASVVDDPRELLGRL